MKKINRLGKKAPIKKQSLAEKKWNSWRKASKKVF